jgi:hypothetical protein
MGERIYLTGDEEVRNNSYIEFRIALFRMGAYNIDSILELKNDDKGTYIELKPEKSIQFANLGEEQNNKLENWVKNKTKLSITEDYSTYISKAFTDMLRDEKNDIELMVDNVPFEYTLLGFKEPKIPRNYGAGGCLEPNHKKNNSKYGNVQVHVKSELFESEIYRNPEGSKASYSESQFVRTLPYNIFVILFHELGHAYAYSIGEVQDPISHDTVNAHMAVFFENFFRSIINIWKNQQFRIYH